MSSSPCVKPDKIANKRCLALGAAASRNLPLEIEKTFSSSSILLYL